MHVATQAGSNVLLTRPNPALHCTAALTCCPGVPALLMHACVIAGEAADQGRRQRAPDQTLPLSSQVKLLIKAGANVLLKNRWGNMAVDDAKRVKATPVVELLEPLVTEASVDMCGSQ